MEVFYTNSFNISQAEDSVAISFGFTLPGEHTEIRTVVMSFSGFKTLTQECIETLKKLEEEKQIDTSEWKKQAPEPPNIAIT